MTKRRLELDAAALKAMAHPLRVQILRVLELHDEVSVTGLSHELGETTGAISYHLRQLARHGFVEEGAADEGGALEDEPAEGGRRPVGRRRRMWRLAAEEIHMTGMAFMADEDTREAAGFVLRELQTSRSRRLAHWFATATSWPEEWQKASSDMDGTLTLDPAQTRALADDLKEVLDRYRRMQPGVDARRVDVQYAVYPSAEGDPR